MIKVIDNFVNLTYYKAIEDSILKSDFPWYWLPSIAGEVWNIQRGRRNLFGFSSSISDAGNPLSSHHDFLLPLFLLASEVTEAKILLRARTAMTVVSKRQVTYEPHIDMPNHGEHINMILYIGDSDGDTIIYKEKFLSQKPYVRPIIPKIPKILTEEQRVTPKANRLVIFNGEHWHTGQSPKEYDRRVILNLNFAESDYRIDAS